MSNNTDERTNMELDLTKPVQLNRNGEWVNVTKAWPVEYHVAWWQDGWHEATVPARHLRNTPEPEPEKWRYFKRPGGFFRVAETGTDESLINGKWFEVEEVCEPWTLRQHLESDESIETTADGTPLEKGNSCWLIERGQAANHFPTIWWRGGDERAGVGQNEMKNWTDDVTKARRFFSQKHAEQIANRLLPPFTYRITEHVFLTGGAK